MAIVMIAIAFAGFSAGVASLHRTAAWVAFAIALAVGGYLAYSSVCESFVDPGMRNAVWNEMGWLWVAASVCGPLLPAGGGAIVLCFGRRSGDVTGFPLIPKDELRTRRDEDPA